MSPRALLPLYGLLLCLAISACLEAPTPLAPARESGEPGKTAGIELYTISEADADCEGFTASLETSESIDEAELEPEVLVSMASAIALVEIEAVLPARYDTASGAPAWQDKRASGITASDITENEHGIFRPIVLRVTDPISTTDGIEGFVVSRRGGCDRSSSFAHRVDAPGIEGREGDRGITLLTKPPDSWSDDPPDFYTHLLREAESRGDGYEPMLVLDWQPQSDDSQDGFLDIDAEDDAG